MAEIIVLPKIGVNMVEGTVFEWNAAVGDKIAKGDVLITVETDKSTQEVYSPVGGTVLSYLVEIGKTIPCQTPIAVIGEPGENIDNLVKGVSLEEMSSAPEPSQAASTPAVPAPVVSNRPGGRVRISPLAKKLAKQSGINIFNLAPATPGGRITKADVERYLQGHGGSAADKRIPLTGIRRVIANKMSESNQNVPRVALNMQVDATEILKWKDSARAQGYKIGINEIIIKALGKALKEHPMMNARIEGDEIIVASEINVGVAVDAENGLIVPVIKDVPSKGVSDISADLRALAARGRAGTLGLDGMSGGTFSYTNLGMLGVDHFVPVVNTPECGILAVGAIKKELVVKEDDSTSVKSLFWMTLAFDHRIIDGAPAARFLADLKRILEWPLSLLQ